MAPRGRLVRRELSEKLDAEITFSFDFLFAGNRDGGRTRAFQLFLGSMALDKAVALAGLIESE